LPLTCSECNPQYPGFPSNGSKHINQVFIYQDPCVKSMKVRLVHGTSVEIKGGGVCSLPRDEGQTEHLRTVAVTASAMLYCLWPILCIFLSAVCCNKYLILSSPPCQCLPTCCMAGGMLASWHRLGMASSCRGSLQLGLLAHSSSIALGSLCYPADLASGSWFTVLEAYVPRTVSCWGHLQDSYSCPLIL